MNLLCGHSVPYSATWPASGSMRNGVCSGRPTLALPTSAAGSSSLPGLPTPAARDWRGGGQKGQLPTAVSLLPTPTVSEANGVGHAADGGMNLRHTISLLPTPTATDAKSSSGANPAWGHGVTLTDAARLLLPTPRASDGTKGGPNQRGSKGDLMLPSAVAQMSGGASTSPPSDAGNASSDDPCPPPTDALGRLNPPLVEWMQGLDAGHVTAVPGIPRGAQLKALGNGVVPRQAVAALRLLAARAERQAVAS